MRAAGGPTGLVFIDEPPPAGHQIPNAGEPVLSWGKRFDDEEQSYEFHDNNGDVIDQFSKDLPVSLEAVLTRRRQL